MHVRVQIFEDILEVGGQTISESIKYVNRKLQSNAQYKIILPVKVHRYPVYNAVGRH